MNDDGAPKLPPAVEMFTGLGHDANGNPIKGRLVAVGDISDPALLKMAATVSQVTVGAMFAELEKRGFLRSPVKPPEAKTEGEWPKDDAPD